MSSSECWLLRAVTVGGRWLDCRIRDGRVAELAPDLAPADGEQVMDGGGRELVPGLCDHHVHLRALAAARRSVDLRGRGLAEVALVPPGTGWLRLVGAGDELRRPDLDAIWPDRPVRVQHRSGALWTLNSAALDRLRPGATPEERATGQFWRSGDRLRALLDLNLDADLMAISAELSAYGITHVTDATPDADPAALAVEQHVLSLGAAGTGPRKIVIEDHRPPDLEGLVVAIRDTHDVGRGVALHVVTRVALSFALTALVEAGSTPADRIEHAAVCDDESARLIAELGVTVVTQPSLAARHGLRYLADSEPEDRPLLWRYAGLLRLGVRVAVSSDAPYGDPCPWITIAAAVRRESDGFVVGAQERVDPAVAFASMLADPADPAGPPRSVALGEPADLCLLSAGLATVLRRAVSGETALVRATFIAGRLTHAAGTHRTVPQS